MKACPTDCQVLKEMCWLMCLRTITYPLLMVLCYIDECRKTMDPSMPFYSIPYDYLGNGPTCNKCQVELYGSEKIENIFKWPKEIQCMNLNTIKETNK
jgi:hypothetical protein